MEEIKDDIIDIEVDSLEQEALGTEATLATVRESDNQSDFSSDSEYTNHVDDDFSCDRFCYQYLFLVPVKFLVPFLGRDLATFIVVMGYLVGIPYSLMLLIKNFDEKISIATDATFHELIRFDFLDCKVNNDYSVRCYFGNETNAEITDIVNCNFNYTNHDQFLCIVYNGNLIKGFCEFIGVSNIDLCTL